MELRTILDWDVARPLLSVPGVIEVNTFGGELKTYEVQLDPDGSLARGISVTRVFEALRRNNSNAGGGYIERNGQVRVIRAEGLVGSLEGHRGDRPRHDRRRHADLRPRRRRGPVRADDPPGGRDPRRPGRGGHGDRPAPGRREWPGGRRPGQGEAGGDPARRCPRAWSIDPFYDRTTLIDKAIATVARNLAEGGVLVIVVLLVLLGNLRAGLIVAPGDPAVDALRRQPDALLRHRRAA